MIVRSYAMLPPSNETTNSSCGDSGKERAKRQASMKSACYDLNQSENVALPYTQFVNFAGPPRALAFGNRGVGWRQCNASLRSKPYPPNRWHRSPQQHRTSPCSISAGRLSQGCLLSSQWECHGAGKLGSAKQPTATPQWSGLLSVRQYTDVPHVGQKWKWIANPLLAASRLYILLGPSVRTCSFKKYAPE